MRSKGEVTRLLSELRSGDPRATEALIPIVYTELHRIASSIMRRERVGHTLQPTAVVHEAYLKLVNDAGLKPENRAHFFAIAGRSMRQVLVDHARLRLAHKRGGEGQQRVELDEGFALTQQQSVEVLALHEALESLQQLDPRQAKVVEMHYFADNDVADIARALGLSERTVNRDLKTARLYLKKLLAPKNIKLP